jgi:hypothetical protein
VRRPGKSSNKSRHVVAKIEWHPGLNCCGPGRAATCECERAFEGRADMIDQADEVSAIKCPLHGCLPFWASVSQRAGVSTVTLSVRVTSGRAFRAICLHLDDQLYNGPIPKRSENSFASASH